MRRKKLKENGIMFLVLQFHQMGNKIFKMLNINFDNGQKF